MKFEEYKYKASKLIESDPDYDKEERKKFRGHTNFSNVVYAFFGNGKCLYDRCYKNSPSHTTKKWFKDTDEVKIIIFEEPEIDNIARHAIEQVLILSYRPINNKK